jgi:glycosyltransferase involved in cell wall biosynthesis
VTKTHSVRLAARASVGLSQPSLDPECAQLSSQVARLAFAVPGDLATPTGGYRYDGRIIQELGRLGWQVDVLDVGDGFPFPSAAQRANALAMLSAVPGGCPIVLDGLAFGALPEAGALRSRTPLIALVHLPLALEAGLDTTQAEAFRESERAALAVAARVMVTSESTARIVIADYDVPSQRVSVVRPGNDPVPPALGSNDGVVRLLSIGSVVPGKGYDVLIAADVFVLASRFEGYGMVLAEAIAHGLPVVSTMAGAIPDTVPAGTGLLVPPDDAAALAQALRCLINDRAERRRLAMNARAAAAQLPTWQDSARLFARAIETVE